MKILVMGIFLVLTSAFADESAPSSKPSKLEMENLKARKQELISAIQPIAHANARLKLCGKDWEKNYLYEVQRLRKSEKYTELHLAFMGGMHGGLVLMKEKELKKSPVNCD